MRGDGPPPGEGDPVGEGPEQGPEEGLKVVLMVSLSRRPPISRRRNRIIPTVTAMRAMLLKKQRESGLSEEEAFEKAASARAGSTEEEKA